MRCPSRRSSPWMRTMPQVWFSVARRTISVVISLLIGGRPGGFGWRHFPATSRRCHRSDVAGVTMRQARRDFGRSRDRAASTARSAQSSRGRGLIRCGTAISWRSASISASLEAELRASSVSQDNAWTKIPYDSRTVTDHRSMNTTNSRSRLATKFSTRTGSNDDSAAN